MLPIRTDVATRARYSQGPGILRLVPQAVARPTNRLELEAVLAWAREEGLSVTPRGGGTSMDGSALGTGLILDLTALVTRGLRVCNRSITAQAGTRMADVARVASADGLRFPPEPSSLAWATVGGVVGTNAAGARSYRDGPTAAWVSALELLTDDGPLRLARGTAADDAHPAVRRLGETVLPRLVAERASLLAALPDVRKDTAGYGLRRFLASGELIDLVIGAEGTLGVVTEVTLALQEIPPHRGTIAVALDDRAALDATLALLAKHDPVAIEFFDQGFLRVVGDAAPPGMRGAGMMILADLESADADELASRQAALVMALRRLVREVHSVLDPAASAELWQFRHLASPMLAGLTDGRRSLQVVEDGCVPRARLAAYLDAIASATRRAGIGAVCFGHAGDGHVHVNLLPDLTQPGWQDAVGSVFDEVTAAQCALGGTPAGEHGAGRLRAPLLERFVGELALELFAAIKAAFDPAGRFNPGVILGDGSPSLASLKVGPDRPTLPGEIEDELDAIERERRWDADRWR